jgi:uncharacterized protein (TIGR02453 family)
VKEDLKRFADDNAVAVPAKAIYRNDRDTRFSKDKTPYKTHVGATFPRRGLPKHAGAGFYFGVSHAHVEVAGGMYMSGPEELAAIRGAIVADARRFAKLVGGVDRRKMGVLTGDKLKRPAKGFEGAPADVAEWLKFKQLYFYVTLGAGVALTPRIRKEVVSRFEGVADVLAWMNEKVLAARGEGADDRPTRPEPMW